MTKEQEEAIDYVQKQIDYFKEQIKFIEAVDSDYYEEEYELYKNRIKQFSTVLNLIQEQQEENKKKDKIIEEMAKFMTNKDIDEDICRYQVVENCKDEKYGVTTNVCINCIKQYFERKRNEL